MAQRDIREFTCKTMLSSAWDTYFPGLSYSFNGILYDGKPSLKIASKTTSWLKKSPLVVKPDMLFGKRGKNNLVYLKKKTYGDVYLPDAITWLDQKLDATVTLHNETTGTLSHFLIEPIVPHQADDEYYIAAVTQPDHDSLYISTKGGVDIEENWDSVTEIKLPTTATEAEVKTIIQNSFSSPSDNATFTQFAISFYSFFKAFHFAYLEFNPIVIQATTIHILDAVAKLDDTAKYLMEDTWGPVTFPTPFGRRPLSKEEQAIKILDEDSGASLKLTVLNPKGRLWTLVAGGGASVVYADTIANTWGIDELANYGEYSGNPSTEETYIYTQTVLDLLLRYPSKKPKVLIIGGAIANFTDVAATFKGIIQALEEVGHKLKKQAVKLYVRRGGPNFETGLQNIQQAGNSLGLDIQVYGPKTHITDIVRISYKDHA